MEAGQPRAATVSVALFASGSGSNVAALLEHRHAGPGCPHYRCLIGNNSGARVMALARERGVPAYHVSRRTHPRHAAYVARLLEVLTGHRIELIVLAGYVKLLPKEVVQRWRGRILNIHPALLPHHGGRGMFGMAPHRAVLAAGERETGVTVHFVDEEYDRGPILMQRSVPVRAGDTPETLARRVLAVEHDTYWRAVEQVAGDLAAGREPCRDAAVAEDRKRHARARARVRQPAAAAEGAPPASDPLSPVRRGAIVTPATESMEPGAASVVPNEEPAPRSPAHAGAA